MRPARRRLRSGRPPFPVGQQPGLVEPLCGLGRADFVAPVLFEALLQMKIDGVEIGHESLWLVGDAKGGPWGFHNGFVMAFNRGLYRIVPA